MGKAEEFHATPQWEAVEPSVAGRPATRKDAEKALAKRLKDLHDGKLRGSHASHGRRVFGNLDPGIRRAEVASRTLQTYRSHFDKNILPAIGSKRIDRISTQDIQRLKTSLSHLSAETVRKHLALLRQMFNHAIDWGYVLRNPARKVRLPTVRRERVKPWNPAELRQFLDAVPEDWYAYFLCVISGGLRIGESLAMRWRNLDWEGGRYHVKESVRRDGTVGPPKTTTSIAWVDLMPEAIRALEAHRARQSERKIGAGAGDQDLIFCTRYGKLLHDRNVVNRIYLPSIERPNERARREGGPELRRLPFHYLRHACASLMITANENPKKIQEQMRHASITMTYDVYGHLLLEAAGHEAGPGSRIGKMLFKT